ncbi:MAG: hypothetical protein AMXMBFR34_53040 [Myxococcaceae bacterium]
MNARVFFTLLAFSSSSVAAQAAADLPAELTRGLSPAQVNTVLEGLRRAGAPECDSALACLSRSMENVRIATSLAREKRSAEQIAAAIGLAAEDEVQTPERLTLTVPKSAPSRGPANAPVTIMTWLDFQCPFSQRLQGTFKELEQAYPGKLRFVVRHLPLPFHKGARGLALMSMAAQDQSRFWEFYEGVFGDGVQSASGLSRKLKLDEATLAKAPQQQRYLKQLAADIDEAARLGAGTPTSYVNGLEVPGPQPLETWRTIVDAELAGSSPAKLGK